MEVDLPAASPLAIPDYIVIVGYFVLMLGIGLFYYRYVRDIKGYFSGNNRIPWWLEWHERVREYSFAHYPVSPHGEWRQKLDRQDRPLEETVALPVKDPFHLPRALICCIDVLDRLSRRAGPAAS